MAQCEICGTEMTQGRGRARRTCSAACRQAAHRRRQTDEVNRLRAAATRPAPAPATPTPPPTRVVPDDSPAGRILAAGADLAHAIEAAARRAADGWPTRNVLPGVPSTSTPETNAAAIRHLADQVAAAILASAPGSSRNRPPSVTVTPAAPVPVEQPAHVADSGPSRNEPPEHPTPAPTAPKPKRLSRKTAAAQMDGPSSAATPQAGIEPRAQKLSKTTAAAIANAAELIRDPDHRDNHRWVLQSGDTVLGYVEPSYGGVSQSGRNGWVSRLGGSLGPRGTTRNSAAEDLAMRWIRLVTATPKRTITGSH
jgi:hypothetical protein